MSDHHDDHEPVYYTPLGHDRGVYYYHNAGSQQIVEMTPAQHTEPNLRALAPAKFWEREYQAKSGADYKAAAQAMIEACHRRGIFDRTRIRGRGAWFDDGRCVLHLGDRIVIGKDSYMPAAVPSKFHYEAGHPLEADLSAPLDNAQAHAFYQLVEMLPWERKRFATLLAGWCVCAHIGGVLRWRPHVWVIGRKGSGKTYVMSNIVDRVLGENRLFVQSDTSEAGIRQELGGDSLPVMFDEAEGTDHRSIGRLQSVLGLVRQSSSETGGRIVKGSTSGKSVHYSIRSCFAFSSINSSLMQESDNSRVSVLELNQDYSKHPFDEIVRAGDELFRDGYIESFYARAIKLAPIIRENAKTFASAVAIVLNEQRAGDQMGALLAGAYSLHSQKIITPEKAREWVLEQDWTEERTEVNGQSDERSLLHYLYSQTLKFRPSSTGVHSDVPIGVLIDAAANRIDNPLEYPAAQAQQALNYAGIKIDGEEVYISNTSSTIKRLLANTPWSTNHSRVLKRLPGARASGGPVYFGHRGSEARSTIIPL